MIAFKVFSHDYVFIFLVIIIMSLTTFSLVDHNCRGPGHVQQEIGPQCTQSMHKSSHLLTGMSSIHACLPIHICQHIYLHICVLSFVSCSPLQCVSSLHPTLHEYTLNPPVFGFSGLNMLKVNEKFPESKMSILWSRYLHWESDDSLVSLFMVNFRISAICQFFSILFS